MACYAAMLGLLIYIGQLMGYGQYYYAGLIAAFLLMLWEYKLIQKRHKTDCFKAFLANNWIGLAIFIGLVFEYYFKH